MILAQVPPHQTALLHVCMYRTLYDFTDAVGKIFENMTEESSRPTAARLMQNYYANYLKQKAEKEELEQLEAETSCTSNTVEVNFVCWLGLCGDSGIRCISIAADTFKPRISWHALIVHCQNLTNRLLEAVHAMWSSFRAVLSGIRVLIALASNVLCSQAWTTVKFTTSHQRSIDTSDSLEKCVMTSVQVSAGVYGVRICFLALYCVLSVGSSYSFSGIDKYHRTRWGCCPPALEVDIQMKSPGNVIGQHLPQYGHELTRWTLYFATCKPPTIVNEEEENSRFYFVDIYSHALDIDRNLHVTRIIDLWVKPDLVALVAAIEYKVDVSTPAEAEEMLTIAWSGST